MKGKRILAGICGLALLVNSVPVQEVFAKAAPATTDKETFVDDRNEFMTYTGHLASQPFSKEEMYNNTGHWKNPEHTGTVSYDFTGTGIEIYSNVQDNCGNVVVTITNKTDNQVVYRQVINTSSASKVWSKNIMTMPKGTITGVTTVGDSVNPAELVYGSYTVHIDYRDVKGEFDGIKVLDSTGKFDEEDLRANFKSDMSHYAYEKALKYLNGTTDNYETSKTNVINMLTSTKVQIDVSNEDGQGRIHTDSETTYNDAEGKAYYAFDGNMTSRWHSDWKGTKVPNAIYNNGTVTPGANHWIMADLGEQKHISKFVYYPRQDTPDTGIILVYKLEFANDAEFTNVVKTMQNTTDTLWAKDASAKIVNIDGGVDARYVRLTAVYTNDEWVAAGEIELYDDGDKTELSTKVSEAREFVTQNGSVYSAETLAEYNKAIDHAESILASGYRIIQNEVIEEISVLENAKQALRIDKTDLNTVIAEADAKQQANYTEASWTIFSEKLTAAKSVAASENPTKVEVDTAKNELSDAMAALVAVYQITIQDGGTMTGGTITIAGGKTSAKKDELVEVVASPEQGYVLKGIFVTGPNSEEISVSNSSFNMPEGNVTISASFVEGNVVEFYCDGTLFDTKNYEKVDGITVPTITKEGYVFKGWFTSDYGETSKKLENPEDYAGVTKVYAQWDKGYTVTVNGGQFEANPISGTTLYQYNTPIKLIAEASTAEGNFQGWQLDGELVTTEREYTFYITKDLNFTAVYADTAATLSEGVRLDDVVVMESYMVAGKKNLRFYGQANMLADKKVIAAGLVWTTDAEKQNQLVVNSSEVGIRTSPVSKVSNIGQFSLTITGVPDNTVLYGKLYVQYQTSDGTTKTEYYYSTVGSNSTAKN